MFKSICRITNKNIPVKILDLGLHPPPNLFKDKKLTKINKYPLTFVFVNVVQSTN